MVLKFTYGTSTCLTSDLGEATFYENCLVNGRQYYTVDLDGLILIAMDNCVWDGAITQTKGKNEQSTFPDQAVRLQLAIPQTYMQDCIPADLECYQISWRKNRKMTIQQMGTVLF